MYKRTSKQMRLIIFFSVALFLIGCTIKGDLKYGADRSNKDGGIHLHARSVTIIHPVKKEPITFLAPPPEDPVWNACISE